LSPTPKFYPPIICLITDGTITNENFAIRSESVLALIRTAVDARISLIQIREKALSAKNLVRLTREVVDLARGSVTKILVNDRADIAAAAGADGVHLTESSLPADVVRSAFPDLVIGVSTHSASSIIVGADRGADFALFGPVFATPGKERAQGLQALTDACLAAPGFPVLAIGGVDETNYKQVLAAGSAGFAAIRFLNSVERLIAIGSGLTSDGP